LLGQPQLSILSDRGERRISLFHVSSTRLPSDRLGTGSAGLGRRTPWFQIKEDCQAAATTVYVSLRVVDNLKTILASILPHTPVLAHRPQQLHEYLGYEGQLFGTQHVVEYREETRSHQALTYDHSGAIGTWTPSDLPPDQALRAHAPMFKKLDESVIEEECARLEG
jgi:methionyl-tRNA synthetase